jgi:tRNA modification GTPase
LVDAWQMATDDVKLKSSIKELEKVKNKYPQKPLLVIANKVDKLDQAQVKKLQSQISNLYLLSAKTGKGVEALKSRLLDFVNTGALRNSETIVTNTRHYSSLLKALEEIEKVQFGMEEDTPSDLLAIDVKEALYHLGEITGQVTNDELLGNIFANFCIGK